MLGVTVITCKSPSLRRIKAIIQSWTVDGLYEKHSGIVISIKKEMLKLFDDKVEEALETLAQSDLAGS